MFQVWSPLNAFPFVFLSSSHGGEPYITTEPDERRWLTILYSITENMPSAHGRHLIGDDEYDFSDTVAGT